MRKLKLCLMAATLVCGASLFTGCVEVQDDNPAPEGSSMMPVAGAVKDGFIDIEEVFAAVADSERVVFLLRHGERGPNYSSTGGLTQNGKLQAQNVGIKIKNGEVAFYAHSDYMRTTQTCENIAIGRGDNSYVIEEWPFLSGNWYKKDSKVISGNGWESWESVSRWEYGVEGDEKGKYSEGFYELYERSELWIDSLKTHLPSMKRINVLVSHDMLVSAMVVYVTNKRVDLRYYENEKWINYLAGLAIIIDPKGNMTFIPVRGLDSGVM